MPVKTLGFREIVGVIGVERPDNERERMDEICLKGANLFSSIVILWSKYSMFFPITQANIFHALHEFLECILMLH